MPCVTPPLRTWRRKGNALLRIASDFACRVDPFDKLKCHWINCVRGGRRYSLQAQGDFCGTAGNGFVIGHQWTNIVLLLNDMLIPLRPIPFYSQRYCRDHALAYQTEHDLVIDYDVSR
jgi:hypothetical protein